MSRLRSVSLIPLSVLAVVPLYTVAPESHKILKQWQTNIGSPADAGSRSIALCPDGTVYVHYRENAVGTVTPQGSLTRQLVTVPSGPTSAACDGRKRLYLGGYDLSVFEPNDAGNLKPLSVKRLPVFITHLFVTPDGIIYGISSGVGGHIVLHELSSQGRILRSFEGTASAPLIPRFDGALTWDPKYKRVLYSPARGTDVQTFDAEGRPLPLEPNRAQLPSRLINVVALPSGEFLAQFTQTGLVNSNDYAFELLNESLNVISTGIRADDFGYLLGASEDGGVYFLRWTEGPGFLLTRAVFTSQP